MSADDFYDRLRLVRERAEAQKRLQEERLEKQRDTALVRQKVAHDQLMARLEAKTEASLEVQKYLHSIDPEVRDRNYQDAVRTADLELHKLALELRARDRYAAAEHRRQNNAVMNEAKALVYKELILTILRGQLTESEHEHRLREIATKAEEDRKTHTHEHETAAKSGRIDEKRLLELMEQWAMHDAADGDDR